MLQGHLEKPLPNKLLGVCFTKYVRSHIIYGQKGILQQLFKDILKFLPVSTKREEILSLPEGKHGQMKSLKSQEYN